MSERYENRTKEDLDEVAKEKGIKGFSAMSKDELVHVLRTQGSGSQTAVRLSLPGSPTGWHLVDGFGYLHPEVAVPVDEKRVKDYLAGHKKQVQADEKAWDEFEAEQEARGNRLNGRLAFEKPSPPVEVVKVSGAEADDGREALAKHQAQSRAVLRSARRGSPEEQVMAHNEAAALAEEG